MSNYLYNKVSDKIDELIKKSPKKELDMDMLKKSLPLKMKLTRYDVISVVRELETDGRLIRHGNKLKSR